MYRYQLIDENGINRGTVFDIHLLMPAVNLLEYIGHYITVLPEVYHDRRIYRCF